MMLGIEGQCFSTVRSLLHNVPSKLQVRREHRTQRVIIIR
jgi:hypothetical protein